jgi:stress-induced morphogen
MYEETSMTDEQLKQKIRDVLKGGYFQDADDLVDVSDGPDDSVHVVIVSRKFDGRRMKEKHDLIWSELSQRLAPEEWGRVSLSIGVSPEEIKAS